MQGNANVFFFVRKPISVETLRDLRAASAQAVAAGTETVSIDVDDAGILDSQTISTLIAVLRDARARGASVELRARHKGILDTLRITGLDKVFTVREPATSAPVKAAPAALPRKALVKPAAVRPGRLVASIATGAFAAASLLGAHDGTVAAKNTHRKPAGAQVPRKPH